MGKEKNPRIYTLLYSPNFRAAHSLYPDMLLGLGVPETDIKRNAKGVVENIGQGNIQNAQWRTKHFTGVVDEVLKAPTNFYPKNTI